jgi:hypothetical protein
MDLDLTDAVKGERGLTEGLGFQLAGGVVAARGGLRRGYRGSWETALPRRDEGHHRDLESLIVVVDCLRRRKRATAGEAHATVSFGRGSTARFPAFFFLGPAKVSGDAPGLEEENQARERNQEGVTSSESLDSSGGGSRLWRAIPAALGHFESG